jgi:outer membrane protein OmpA-like peptidoglycan-associated protein
MRIIITSLLTFLCIFINGFAQTEKEIRKIFLEAESYFLYENEYELAVPLYLTLHHYDSINANINYKIGVCYLSIPGKKAKAIPYLEAAVKNTTSDYHETYKEKSSPIDAYYYLGLAYQVNNLLDEAIKSYQQFKKLLDVQEYYQIDFVNLQIKACEIAEKLQEEPIKYIEKKLNDVINAYQLNFNPVVSGNDSILVYTAKIGLFNYIFYARKIDGQWSTPVNISINLETKEDCTSASLSYNGDKLFLFKNDGNIGNIYESNFVNGKWTKIKKLPRNINTKYWESHACLSPDEKVLYFTSNRTRGFGGLDIYKSELQKNGEWGPAQNLGPNINSPYNEDTPFIINNGNTLYFSSQGHYNMGGFDIFYSNKLKNNKWSVPINLGYPINTTDDERFYTPVEKGSKAYYARYTTGEYTKKEIYEIDIISGEIPVDIAIKGKIGLQDNKPGFDTTFSVCTVDTLHSDTIHLIKPDLITGEFFMKVPSGNYYVIFSSEGYETKIEQVSIPENFNRSEIILNPLLVPKEVTRGKYIVIKNILFGYDSYSLDRDAKIILEKLFSIMQQYPSLQIEVIGHTDSKGAEVYNLKLSQNRAYSVINYLVDNGINRSRFSAAGVGESVHIAINTNPDGTDNAEGRRFNRRVNIKVLKSDFDLVIQDEIYVPEHLKFTKDLNFTIILLKSKEKLFRDYFTRYDLDELHYVKPRKTFDGYLYTIGIYKQKPEALKILGKLIHLGFTEAGIVDQHELRELTDIGRTYSRDKFARYSKKGKSLPTYTIQIHALLKPADINDFQDLSDVNVTFGKDGFYRYTVGEYIGYTAAKDALKTIKNNGYTNAYIRDIKELK